MVQAKMGLRPLAEEIIDVEPNNFHKTKKKIWQNNEWVDKTFIRLLPHDHNKYGGSEMEKWCHEHYGAPKFQGAWFKASNYILMDEKTYVHYKLCE
jgi:hypothetical protein